MKTFNVIRLSTGRVVLDNREPNTEKGEVSLQTIKAKSWLSAREKVEDSQLYHIPTKGWFELQETTHEPT